MTGFKKTALPGIPFMLVSLILAIVALGLLNYGYQNHLSSHLPLLTLAVLIVLLGGALLISKGLYTLDPNAAAVLTFFGRYMGTVTQNGLLWNFPLYKKQKVSLRVQNFESSTLKVNDLEGSPINIAAIVVWQVGDPAEAVFNVEDYAGFVTIQAESALRTLASRYPYDSETQTALRSNPDQIASELQQHIADLLQKAGIVVVDARISHLAYSSEIAQAMLQRQQAQAIVDARAKIVAGAVNMVEDALAALEKSSRVQLDEERKAQMVANLLAVLCSDRGTQPVINSSVS